ncbi:uncharacterized protein BYT42DRAFT_606785 [Radiomyces spectabilis]|uniref:uncharacterized protein n=1 Tax=Radiomyces spectabilis TaxID=64574 RepID=UPI0022207013|nr:uncharacterized protein BYT42DRAFT_606785 [Radiomyces spectabilis]KAI8372943.1 hypothetical protein BYT42DRAFT_606785 [Radiomyces spectabilis]
MYPHSTSHGNKATGQRPDNYDAHDSQHHDSIFSSSLDMPLHRQSMDSTLANFSMENADATTSSSYLESDLLSGSLESPSAMLGNDALLPTWDSMYGNDMQPSLVDLGVTPSDNIMDNLLPDEASKLFTAMCEQDQQAILFSDPNFARQQQLLQEQRQAEQQAHTAAPPSDSPMETVSPVRSNLSAMFGQSPYPPSTQKQDATPKSDTSASSAATTTTTSTTPAATSMAHRTTTDRGNAASKSKKDGRRLSAILGTGRMGRTNPIPISRDSGGHGSKQSSSVPHEIDHQRRFSELQAKFRVNYSRKPNQGSSMTMSSSYSNTNPRSNRSDSRTVLGSSVPLSVGQYVSRPNVGPNVGPSADPNARRKSHDYTLPNDINARGNGKFNASRGIIHLNKTPYSTTTAAATTTTTTTASAPTDVQASSFPSRTMPIQIQRVNRLSAMYPLDSEEYQRKLDFQLENANFDDITVSELKEMLRQRGKPATGRKAILLQRLQEERELVKAGRQGPRTSMSGSNATEFWGQPQSVPDYQSSAASFPDASPVMGSPSSIPNSNMFLSSSAGSNFSLHQSIANMNLTSPIMSSQPSHPTPPRRYSPYMTSPSPKQPNHSPYQQPTPDSQRYSSSVPTGMFASNHQAQPMETTPSPHMQARAWNPNTQRQKSYAPLTPSNLGTPDKENKYDPFNFFGHSIQSPASIPIQQQRASIDYSADPSANMEGIEWMDSLMLQEGQDHPSVLQFSDNLLSDDLMTLLANQPTNENGNLNSDHGKSGTNVGDQFLQMDMDNPLYDNFANNGR